MNRLDMLFASIKADLKKAFTKEQKFSDFVLSDGTKITSPSNDLEIGAEIYMVDEMGNQTPLDPGDYVLNDGRTITTDGKTVTAIAGGDTTESETPVSDANTTTETSKVKMEDGLTNEPSDEGDLATRITDLESKLEELANMIKTLMEGQSSTNEQMMSAIKEFGAEPGDLPIRTTKRGYEEYSDKSSRKVQRSAALQELRENIEQKRNDKTSVWSSIK